MNELWHGTPEAKQWDVLRNGWDGWSEGQGANLQVGQAGWPLLRAAAGVCADTWRHVAVKWICVPRLCYIVAWRHLPTNKEQHFGVKLHTSLKHTHAFNVFQPVVWDKCLCKIQQISHFTHLQLQLILRVRNLIPLCLLSVSLLCVISQHYYVTCKTEEMSTPSLATFQVENLSQLYFANTSLKRQVLRRVIK